MAEVVVMEDGIEPRENSPANVVVLRSSTYSYLILFFCFCIILYYIY
jgi:hypothetical protein